MPTAQAIPATSAFMLRDRRALLWGIPLLSLVISLLARRGEPFSWHGALLAYLLSGYFTTGYWLANRALWRGLQRRLPRPDQTRRRLWLLTAMALGLAAVVTCVLTLPLHGWRPVYFPLTLSALVASTVFSLFPTAIVLTLYETAYFFRQWQANQHRADQLARAATQAQLDQLTRQVDPHFLFNSLNTLAALIDPANDAAQHYVEGLADVYRYVLLARQRATVPLADELASVRTYLALQQVRFGESLRAEVQAAPTTLGQHVAPLSVQELVENALKHNEASRARPLGLRVVAEAGTVRVENTYQPRPAGLAPGTGLGLANLRQRYALLGAEPAVSVAQAGGTFTVTLPLLRA